MASKGRPFRHVEFEGYEILVGKGARENDELSTQVAEPEDWWLHVADGTAGSHVIVRNPAGTEVPREVLQRAGELAAWHSKARNQRRAKVHYCKASCVSKRAGAPTGQVEIRNFRTLFVGPRGTS